MKLFSFQMEQQFVDCRVYWRICCCLEIGHFFILFALLWGLGKEEEEMGQS